MKEINVLVVVDEDGEMRPMAGIWIDNEHGAISSEIYRRKNEKHGDVVLQATLTLKD